MPVTASTTPNPFVLWLLIIVSTLLVAGITYVYTNRNKRLTLIFTLATLFVIALIHLFNIVDLEIHKHFIGGFTETQISYVVVGPGWKQLWYAWHLWVLPVISVLLLASIIFYAIWHYARGIKHQPPSSPLVPLVSSNPYVSSSSANAMRSQRLNTFMVLDAAKKEAQVANEKLAEALLKNAAYEIQLSDLTLQVEELQNDLKQQQETATQEAEILQLELASKKRENDYLTEQLAERARKQIQLQKLLDDFLQAGGSSSPPAKK